MCLRILILEDYAPLRRVLAVTLARSACEALRVLAQHAYDTLLVDMDMANGESWRVLQALDTVRHPIPIVVLLSPGNGEGAPLNWRPSADAVAGEWHELESCGVRAMLLKPVGKEALLNGLRATLQDTGRQS